MVGREGFEPTVFLCTGFTVRRYSTALAACPNSGGWGRIRTHDAREGMVVFKTTGINRSPTHPQVVFSVGSYTDRKPMYTTHSPLVLKKM